MNAEDLTPAERLLVKRRRPSPPLSQPNAAKAMGVTFYRYRRWEKGIGDPPIVFLKGGLLDHEECYINRKRAGVSLGDLAKELGVTAWWLCQMEYGHASGIRLFDYWGHKTKPWRPKKRVARSKSGSCRP